MALITGEGGAVTFAGGYATNVNNWSINAEAEEYEFTKLGDSWRRFRGGVTAWTGSYTASWDDQTSSILKLGGAASAATFQFASSATPGTLTGNIVVTSVEHGVPVGAKGDLTVNFRGDDTLTWTIPS